MSTETEVLLRTGFLIHDVSRMRHRILDRHVRSWAGITRPQWWLLIHITRNQEYGISQVELARVADMGKVPLGNMIDRLEKHGLVSRASIDGDRRAKRVLLTEAGWALIREMQEVAIALGRQFMACIPEERQRELNETLHRMKRNMQAIEADDPPEKGD